jgi:pyruvate-formate lyase-activating enzyme
MGLVLDPRLHLRPDVDRAILYPKNSNDFDEGNFVKLLHPLDAILLGLFDGTRTTSDVARMWGQLMGVPEEDAFSYLSKLLSIRLVPQRNIGDMLVSTSIQTASEFTPADYLVPNDTVNLTDLRCRIPICMQLLPTMRCVTDCIYCYADTREGKNRPLLSVRRIQQILEEAKKIGIFTVDFSGGDSFCRGDIFDILEIIKDLGMMAFVPTKFPLNKKQVDRLSRVGNSLAIQVSIDSVDPLIIIQMASSRGYSERIVNSLSLLADAGIPIRTNTVVTPLNVNGVGPLVDYLASLGIVQHMHFTTYSRSLYRPDESLFLEPRAIESLDRLLKQCQARYPLARIVFSGGKLTSHLSAESV